jgi:dynein heavy chain
VLCFSPIGSSLRNRIRDFPSIVNCTTIDWFSEWPPDALEAVAKKFLADIEMSGEVRAACSTMVQIFHTSTQDSAVKFENELKRIYYVTPTSYLELINTFKNLLDVKRKEVMALKNRYANGYDCLVDTELKVNSMQKELEDLQPILIETGKETAAKLIIVTEETEAADKIKTSVAIEEADASKIAASANAIKTDCETQLASAIPALKAAEDAVNCIQKGDIAVLKGLANPPPDVKLVTGVVC